MLLVTLSVLCVRGKLRGIRAIPFRSRSPYSGSSPFPSSSPPPPRPSRSQSDPPFRRAVPVTRVGAAYEISRRDIDPPQARKRTVEPYTADPLSEKAEDSMHGSYLDEVSIIDPGFMRELSTIMEASTERSLSRHSQASRILSFTDSAYSRQSNLQSTSTKSDSTIILPGPFPSHSRHSSESGTMFGPTRLNSATGPWRDSIWSTTATPTSVLPPSSAYASQRHSRWSQSLSTRLAQARDSFYWTDDQSPRSSKPIPGSALLPPLPTPGLGKSPSISGLQSSSGPNDPSASSWPLP